MKKFFGIITLAALGAVIFAQARNATTPSYVRVASDAVSKGAIKALSASDNQYFTVVAGEKGETTVELGGRIAAGRNSVLTFGIESDVSAALGRAPADFIIDSYRTLFLRHTAGAGATGEMVFPVP